MAARAPAKTYTKADLDAEVKKALNAYKEKVAEKVIYYRDEDGRLCDDEARELVSDLDLEALVPQHMEVNFYFEDGFEILEWPDEVPNFYLFTAIRDALEKQFPDGLAVETTASWSNVGNPRKYPVKVRLNFANSSLDEA